jgi:hypothetical protein
MIGAMSNLGPDYREINIVKTAASGSASIANIPVPDRTLPEDALAKVKRVVEQTRERPLIISVVPPMKNGKPDPIDVAAEANIEDVLDGVRKALTQ